MSAEAHTDNKDKQNMFKTHTAKWLVVVYVSFSVEVLEELRAFYMSVTLGPFCQNPPMSKSQLADFYFLFGRL